MACLSALVLSAPPALSQPLSRPSGIVAAPSAERPDPRPAAAQPAPDAAPSVPAKAAAGDTASPATADTPVAAGDPPNAPLHETLRESDFDHAACRLGLRRLGVELAGAAPLSDPDNPHCGIARPVEIRSLQPGIALAGPAVMRCDTARQLTLWLREAVIPAARRLEGAPRVTSIALGTGYACRGVVGAASTATVSEHALGNAVDVAGFGFDNGLRLDIAPRGDRGGMEMAFQNAVQAAACLYFQTVLGPGSNAAHDDHLHLDIKARTNGFRLCQ